MGVRKYVTETARAVPRQGLAGLIVVMLVMAGITWGAKASPLRQLYYQSAWAPVSRC